MVSALTLQALALAACPTPPQSGCAPDAVGVALDRLRPARIRLPEDSRAGQPPPAELAVKGSSGDGQDAAWTAPLPFIARGLFLEPPPAGLTLLRNGEPVPPGTPSSERVLGWRLDRRALTLSATLRDREPSLALRCSECADREGRLNFRWSPIADPEAFIRYTATVGLLSKAGLLVPAPGEVAFDIDVPGCTDLRFEAWVLPPEWGYGEGADGVTFRVIAELADREVELWSAHVQPSEHRTVSVPLDGLGGQRARLRLITEPGASDLWDYAFFADPRITSRRSQPRRIVLAFVDTLRADRTSLHGGPPEATPSLAQIAAQGLTFENAYSVAPWTLPAWRSAITGRRPERWDDGPTLVDTLRDRGWATAMFAGNVYLSANFEGARGWGHHEVALAPPAPAQVDAGLRWLGEHRQQDALLVVHLMDPHLPYLEPSTHRSLFAGPAPPEWPEAFSRRDVLDRAPTGDVRRWIEARYLNNVRYADDAIGRLADALHPDDLLVVFSDHGEEFWDEDGFEHGHSLSDAVTRVPLVIRHPRAGVGRESEPASLLDLVPTVLGLLDLPTDDLDGRDLLVERASPRPLPLGHALYGYERWGAVSDRLIYRTVAGFEQISDGPLGADSGATLERGRAAVEQAHRADVASALRIAAVSLPGPSERALRIVVDFGAPVAAIVPSWPALPTDRIEVNPTPQGALVLVPAGFKGVHEVLLVPPAGRQPSSAHLSLSIGDAAPQRAGPFDPDAPNDGAAWWRRDTPGTAKVTVGPGIAVRPASARPVTVRPAPDQREALRQLGYALTAEP